jgi:thiosulfate reductase cytochrome b subunit
MTVRDTTGSGERAERGRLVKRHRPSTRIWHWVNFATIVILLGSGLMIFNAHPRLYWGSYGANSDPAWLEIGSEGEAGYLRIGGLTVTTTGFLGAQPIGQGQVRRRAIPSWATIPSSYNLGLSRRELRPAHIASDIMNHAMLRFHKGEAARRYNILQKMSYLGVIFVLIPLMVLTGRTMSPGMVATWTWLLDLFGGRQSARSIHFIVAMLLLLFLFVHILMVALAGSYNEVRSMITGRFRLPKERAE